MAMSEFSAHNFYSSTLIVAFSDPHGKRDYWSVECSAVNSLNRTGISLVTVSALSVIVSSILIPVQLRSVSSFPQLSSQ